MKEYELIVTFQEVLTTDSGCQYCPAGTKNEGLSCVPCPPGEYQNAEGATSCDQCSAGLFTATSGSIKCTECPAGTYSAQGASQCTDCGAGQESNSNRTVCEDCPPGQYLDAYSRTCSPCPPGTYSFPGASECTPCEKGTYNDEEGQESCKPCDVTRLQYTAFTGSTFCLICQGLVHSVFLHVKVLTKSLASELSRDINFAALVP